MTTFPLKPLIVAITSITVVFSSGCSTLTGIPSHGGGKRFAQEQRLVSASIRSTLKDIDVTPLRGKKVAIVYDLISDEGGGNISGGRLGILAGLTSGYSVSPVTSSTGQFQIFNLAETGSRYSNTATGVNSSNATTTNIVQSTNSSGTQNSQSSTSTNAQTNSQNTTNSTGTQNTTTNIGAVTSTSKNTNNNTNTTNGYETTTKNGSSTNTSTTQPIVTTTNVGEINTTNSNGASTITTTNPTITTKTQTGSVITTQTTGANTSTQQIGSSTNTQVTKPQVTTTTTPQVTTTVNNSGSTVTNTIPTVTSSSTGTSNTTNNTGASTNTSSGNTTNNATTNGSSNSTQKSNTTASSNNSNFSKTDGTTTSNGTETTNSKAETNGKETINREVVSPSATNTKSQSKGNEQQASITLQYRGLGNYENLSVPKSDASLLMGLVRNYLILNGVVPTTPTDPNAEAILYVTVDVFGIIRSRFDAYVVNRESVIAETAMEMMAFDRGGNMILSPRNANHEAKYDENYFLWTGPYKSSEIVRPGKGLLVNFSDVDGTQKSYPSDVERHTNKNNAQ